MTETEGTLAARTLAAQRKRRERACVVCGRPIAGITIRRYCSQTCRTKAYRDRRRGESERLDADAGL